MIGHLFRVAQSALRERRKEKERSPHWGSVRDAHLKMYPMCAACGCSVRPEVHHISPFHIHPELELIETNLITLCMGPNECHLRIGHGGSWKSWNSLVVKHADKALHHPDQRPAIEHQAMLMRRYEDKK